MEEKKIFKYIKRLLPFVFMLSAVLSVLINISLTKERTYSASAVINYFAVNLHSSRTI